LSFKSKGTLWGPSALVSFLLHGVHVVTQRHPLREFTVGRKGGVPHEVLGRSSTRLSGLPVAGRCKHRHVGLDRWPLYLLLTRAPDSSRPPLVGPSA